MPLASLRPLRSRNFALIWSAGLVSNLGSWMQTVALGVLVYTHTGSAGAGLSFDCRNWVKPITIGHTPIDR